jgi:hypothetical protein
VSAARTIPFEEYQKLPEDKRSRPLTDREYKQLSPAQLRSAGLAEDDEGAPADFNGPVFPNPDHIQVHDDSESNIPVTRLPRGVSFNRGNYTGDAQSDLSNPSTADISSAAIREMGDKMSAAPMPWDKYAKAAPPAGKPGGEEGPWAKYGTKGADTSEDKTEKPGFLDRDIPLAGPWYNPTLSGVQSIGRGIRGAVQGIGSTLDPRAHGTDEEALVASDPRGRVALPLYRTLRGIGETAKQLPDIPGAIRDINASPDPLGLYAKAAQETAGQGAGQALTALATEGAGRVIGAGAEAATRPGATLNRIARTTGKLGADVAEDIPGVRALGKVKKNWEATAPKTPAEVAQARGLSTGSQPAIEPSEALGRIATPKATPEVIPRELPRDLDATVENKPFAGGPDEPPAPKIARPLDATGENKPFAGGPDEPPAPKIARPLDATGENKPFAGGMDEYTAPKARLENTGRVPSPSETAQNIRAYRARSIGEEGIPYRAESHAQATSSQPQAEGYLGPRAETEGVPQELTGVDLSQTPGFSARPGPGGAAWYKFHGDVPESAVTRIARPGETSARPITEEPIGETPEAPVDPMLARLREHASNIQAEEGARVPEEDEDLTDLLTKSVAQANASRGR